MTQNRTVMPIHTHGDAVNKRQASLHHVAPLPAATAEGDLRDGAPGAPAPLAGGVGNGEGCSSMEADGSPFLETRGDSTGPSA